MNIFSFTLLVIAAIWLLGAILAIIEMWLVNITILYRYDSRYTLREFIEGFFKSWWTLFVVTGVITNEFNDK